MLERQESGKVYYCPASRDLELQPGGGFDVCCDTPDRHVTREQLIAVIEDTTREHLWDKVPGTADDAFEFEPVAPKVADAVLALLSTTSTKGETQS